MESHVFGTRVPVSLLLPYALSMVDKDQRDMWSD